MDYVNVNADEDDFLHDFVFSNMHDAGYLDVDVGVDYGADDEGHEEDTRSAYADKSPRLFDVRVEDFTSGEEVVQDGEQENAAHVDGSHEENGELDEDFRESEYEQSEQEREDDNKFDAFCKDVEAINFTNNFSTIC